MNHRQPESRTPSHYLGAAYQRRLIMLVLALGLVLAMANEAGKPANWYWLWGGHPPEEDSPAETAQLPADLDAPPLDTRIEPPTGSQLAPGEFISPAREAPPLTAEQLRDFPPGVQPELLAAVRDDTVFRAAEHDAWFHLLELLATEGPNWAAEHSAGQVSFVQLYRQPEVYRGKLITLRGTVRRVLPIQTAPDNDYGITGYYQLWLQPEDRPRDPIVVYLLHLPPEFPTGSDVAEPVTLSGFFFKRWAYMAQDSLRAAPLVLAANLQWRTGDSGTSLAAEMPSGSRLVTIVAIALAFAGLVVINIWRVSRHLRSKQSRGWGNLATQEPLADSDIQRALAELSQTPESSEDSPEADGEKFTSLEQAPSTAESLKRLADDAAGDARPPTEESSP